MQNSTAYFGAGSDDSASARLQIAELETRLAQCAQEVAALQRTQQALLGLVEQAGTIFFAVDGGWRYTYVSPTAAAPFGQTPSALLGQTVWESYPQLLGTIWEERYRDAMA